MKLYYVYYAIQKNGESKVGCTSKPKNRKRRYLEFILLESFTCAIQAGDREIELQQKYFGKRDGSIHYVDMLKKGRRGDEDVKKKISAGLKRAYKEGKRTERDLSYITDEYKKHFSKISKNMWKNPKRKDVMPKGCDNAMSIFTESDIRFIRNNYHPTINQFCKIPKGKLTGGELAKKYNTSKTVIANIIKRKTYTQIV
jgi:hypothetical protein